MSSLHLNDLSKRLQTFADERDWDQFHSPKNLAMALAGEAGELLEIFQWLSEAESARLPADKLNEAALELADLQIYLIRLAGKLGIDLAEVVEQKIRINRERYPAERVRGSAMKYNEYDT